MVSASGRYVIVFNGEIFNLQEVKAELGAVSGRGVSELYPIMMSKDPVLRFRRRSQLNCNFLAAVLKKPLQRAAFMPSVADYLLRTY